MGKLSTITTKKGESYDNLDELCQTTLEMYTTTCSLLLSDPTKTCLISTKTSSKIRYAREPLITISRYTPITSMRVWLKQRRRLHDTLQGIEAKDGSRNESFNSEA